MVMSARPGQYLVAATLVSLVLISSVACNAVLGDLKDGTGSSSGGSSSSGGNTSCLQQLASGPCVSCLQSNCGSQVNEFANSCSAYLDCVCPGGNFEPCLESTCSSQIASSCQTAANDIDTCQTQSCAGPCAGDAGTVPTCSSGSGGGNGCSAPMSCGSAGQTYEFCDNAGTCSYVLNGQTFSCASCNAGDLQTCSTNVAQACQ
jgi:hypothetical protein